MNNQRNVLYPGAQLMIDSESSNSSSSLSEYHCICAQCQRVIYVRHEMYLELNEKFYHKNCYKCAACPVYFSVNQTEDRAHCAPIQDKSGKLFCANDYIKELRCLLCAEKFTPTSVVLNLAIENRHNETDAAENLVHMECLKCSGCMRLIDIMTEYSFDSDCNRVNCKSCALSKYKMSEITRCNKTKQMKSKHHRLSFRQREQLMSRVLADRIETEKLVDIHSGDLAQNPILISLANELKCSIKAIVHYLTKDFQHRTVKLIVDLKNLDQTLAPNICPENVLVRRPVVKADCS